MDDAQTPGRPLPEESKSEAASKNSATLRGLCERFRDRASLLRRLAYTVLGLICVTLGGGVYLFVIAGDIVGREAAASQREAFSQLSQQVKALAPNTMQVLKALEALATRSENVSTAFGNELSPLLKEASITAVEMAKTARELRKNAATPMSRETAQKLDTLVQVLGDESTIKDFREVVTVLPSMLRDIGFSAKELTRLTEYAEKNLPNYLESKANDALSTPILVSTLATRVGALVVLIFLVQILINLYRYNIRLAAYFDARADALEMTELTTLGNVSMVDLMTVLSPDNLDFGKTPPSPVEHAVALVREMTAKQPKQ